MPRINLKPTGPGDGATMPSERIKPVSDILDWVSSIFGFQVTWSLNAFMLFLLSISMCFPLHLSDLLNC